VRGHFLGVGTLNFAHGATFMKYGDEMNHYGSMRLRAAPPQNNANLDFLQQNLLQAYDVPVAFDLF
jgi:hypothetical protein